MKKCFFLLLSILFCTMASAQTDIWVWKNGEYTKVQQVDSVTFANPAVEEPENPAVHQYVDLGLPSGLLWATCNVGADKPEEYGDYFAWGETSPKETYDFSTYKWCNGNFFSITKYCTDETMGVVDTLAVLEPADDAATVNWGSAWRMPTRAEHEELVNGCNWTWTTDYKGSGVAGRIGTSIANGNTIFIPASGYYGTLIAGGQTVNEVGEKGYLWSSTHATEEAYNAQYHYFGPGMTGWGEDVRCYGFCVRAVTEAK